MIDTTAPSPTDRITAAWRDAWAPRPRIPLAEWCQQNIRLDTDYEATAGVYDLAARPFWREPLEAFEDPEVQQVTFLKSTQIGGTLTLLSLIVAMSEVDPAPMMVVTPDLISCVELRDRVYAMASKTRATRERVPRERDWNNRHIDLGTCRIYMAYAGARQRLRGRPCAKVFLTEVDVYQGHARGGDPVAAASRRVGAFYRHKILAESTPDGDDSVIAARYEASDQRKWHGCCPHCGAWQQLRFFPYKHGEVAGKCGIGGLTDDQGAYVDEETARAQAHYICVRGCRIEEQDKSKLVETGRWVPKGQRIEDGQLVGERAKGARHAGFHLWSIMSPTTSFGSLAGEYIVARRDGKLRDFWQNSLGLKFASTTRMPTWQQIAARLAGDHPRCTVPAAAWFLTAGIDVQEDRVYGVIRGWGDGRTSWLVDWVVLNRVMGESEDDSAAIKGDLIQLQQAVLARQYPIFGADTNVRGESLMRVRLAGIDANYRTPDVHDWLSSLEHRDRKRIRAIRGDSHVKTSKKYRMTEVEVNARTGRRYEGGLELWGIAVDHFKHDLADRFHIHRDEPGAFVLTSDVGSLGVEYLRQLVNESKVQTIGKDGRIEIKWQPRGHMIGHDYWDCEVYASALADMVVGSLGWDARRWPVPRQRPLSPPPVDHGVAVRDYNGVSAR